MRLLAFDVGASRTGVAVSDPSGTLARPLTTLRGRQPLAAALRLIATFRDEGIAGLVVGLPRRLDGGETHATALAREFGEALARATGLPVHYEDERLTSVAAEELLAGRERNWRARKARLDAVAAAVLLQDVLARRSGSAPRGAPADAPHVPEPE